MSIALNDGSNGTRYDVPLYFLEEYPKFIEFMDVFYNWLYNQQGFTAAEIEDYIKNSSDWLDPFTTDSPLEQLIAIKSQKAPGRQIKNHLEDHYLVRGFEKAFSLDAELLDVDGRPLFGEVDHDTQIDNWYDSFGFQRTADKAFQNFARFADKNGERFITSNGDNFSVYVADTKRRTLDHVRWLKLLKHIYRIRGSKKAIELFFWIYFGCPIQVKYPKEEIGGLDDNFDLDGTVGMRDDYYYDEYSYVITVPGDVSQFEGVFNKVFREHFHPAGFTVFLESSRG
ncbi:head closure Hc2 [Erwinia phage vB_EamM-Bue1]|uniref:Baseplate wedge subunit n=1 Tax=Erwinia phage vB_EamM-Bue1 TaxID=2099338 RepID=A0A2P1JUG4_9CAUD|nr:head closure Hc2 [Erwinia phage vB_EamM-Bue1]AVO22992.1 hypothetical protein [Erwinia phage vB_EamM-Bue1]